MVDKKMLTIQQIRDAGVVGAGGAGFPTCAKLDAKADTLVCNAAECEPLLHKDKEILRNFPKKVIRGLRIAAERVGAERVVVGLKRKYHDIHDLLAPLLPSDFELFPLNDIYPAGDEFILVYETLGRVIPPGGLPLHTGTVVLNVETAFHLAEVEEGVSNTHKFLTVAGAIRTPMSLRVPIGCSILDCIEAAGGATLEEPVVLVGGPMMGHLVDSPRTTLVTKTTGGVILLPQDHPLVEKIRRPLRDTLRIARSACDQCSFCTELCPRNLLGHPVEPHKAMRGLLFGADALIPGTQFCSGCNLCARCSCPEGLDPCRVMQTNRQKWVESRERWENPPFRKNRPFIHMQNRQTPIPKLVRRLGLEIFNQPAPLDLERSNEISPRSVGIPVKQHIGAPCVPCVAEGARVAEGECVGTPPTQDGKSALGAAIHASIRGRVAKIADGVIWIERE
ncbi:MAG: SLBB domain-containing protein [Planctomycetia bacterium]|nr:SLBB domain-containing protein [Planctomycetia bacterium]